MSNSYTEDHLVEQPAIQLMQHELGWDVVNCYGEWDGGTSNLGRDGKREVGNIEHRTSNFEHRSEEKRKKRPALQRLNPNLPVEAIEGAVEEICRDRTALSLAEANREIDKLPSGNSKFKPEEVASMSDLMNGFQCFWGFHRMVKLAFLLKWHSVFTESDVSRMRESGDFV